MDHPKQQFSQFFFESLTPPPSTNNKLNIQVAFVHIQIICIST
jgi:hypothetical protein